MPDLFHYRYGVYFFFGVLTEVYQNVEQFFNICHVEVASHYQVTAAPVVLTEERVYVLDAVYTVGAITQMAQPEFATKCYFLLEPLFVEKFVFAFLLRPFILLAYLFKEMRYGLRFDGSVAAYVPVAGISVDLDVGNTGAVLAAIVLFLHQYVHLVHGIRRAILIDVI